MLTPEQKANLKTHETRGSMASTYDVICKQCGSTDEVPGGWGGLIEPCKKETDEHKAARKAAQNLSP